MSQENKPTGAGKGDKPRPVNGNVYRANHDAINWPSKKKKTEEELEDEYYGEFSEEIEKYPIVPTKQKS